MTEIGEAMAGSGSSRWEEPHTDAVPEEAAGLDRAAHSTAGAGGGEAVDVMTRSDAGLSSGAQRVIREEASSILRALGEGGQKGTRERPNAGAVESLQAGDCGTYLIIGKDVVAREYTVLLKNTEGKDVGVAKWPCDAQGGELKPSGLSSGRPLRRESLTAEPSQRSRDSSYVDGDLWRDGLDQSPAFSDDGGARSGREWLEEYERLTLSGWGDSSSLEVERREREARSRAIPTTFGCTRMVEPAEPPGPALPAGSAWAQHAGVPGEMGTERFHVRSDEEDSSDRQSMSRDSFEGFLRELGVEDPSAIEKHWNAMNQGGRVRPTTTRPRFAWETATQADLSTALQHLLLRLHAVRGGQRQRPEEAAGLEVCEGTQADEWDAPHCPLKVRDGGLVRLRESPHRKSREVTGDLPGGTPLRAVSWKIRHESIEVHVVRGATGEALCPSRWVGDTECEVGWVAVEEVVGYDDRRWYRGLTEEEWYSSSWQTTVKALRVWVSRGGRTWQELYDAILPIQEQSRQEKKHLNKVREVFEAEGYTYVALGLGRMWQGDWEATNLRLHVTIAYAAAMEDNEMKALQEILTNQVHEWARLEPNLRPLKVTRFRRWETQTRMQKRGDTSLTRNCTRKPIVTMGQGEVEAMVAEERIHTLDLDEDDEESLGEFVGRLYSRDRDRLREGRERAAALSKNDGLLRVECADEGLGAGSLEIQDLLAYLADTVRFFAGASKRLDPAPGRLKGKLVPPYVTPPERWHITKQGSWLRSHECTWEE